MKDDFLDVFKSFKKASRRLQEENQASEAMPVLRRLRMKNLQECVEENIGSDFGRVIDRLFFETWEGTPEDTVRGVMRALDVLQIKLPQQADAFIDGVGSPLIFLSDAAMVVRIYNKHYPRLQHISNISNPVLCVRVGQAVIEICPGVSLAHMDKNSPYYMKRGEYHDKLKAELLAAGIKYNDAGDANIGLLPNGTPIVIDRGAAAPLTSSANKIRGLLENFYFRSLRKKKREKFKGSPQQRTYAPLYAAMEKAWPQGASLPDADKLRKFWSLCAEFKKSGISVAGWEGYEGDDYKTVQARNTAQAYAAARL